MKVMRKLGLFLFISSCLVSNSLIANPTKNLGRALLAAGVVGVGDFVFVNGYYPRFLTPDAKGLGAARPFRRQIIDTVTPGFSALAALNLAGGIGGVSSWNKAGIRASVRLGLHTGPMITSGVIFAGLSAVGHALAVRDSES